MTLVDGRCSPVRTASKVFVVCLINVLFLCFTVPGTALEECPWHKRKCPDPMMSLFINGVVSSTIRYYTIQYFFTGNYNVPIEVYSNLNYLKGTLCMPIYIFYIV